MRAWFALMLVAIGCDGPPLTPGRISDERAYRTVDGGAPPRRECVETAVTLIRALRWDDCRDLDGPSGDFSVMTFFNPDGTVREARFDAHGYLRVIGHFDPEDLRPEDRAAETS